MPTPENLVRSVLYGHKSVPLLVSVSGREIYIAVGITDILDKFTLRRNNSRVESGPNERSGTYVSGIRILAYATQISQTVSLQISAEFI